MSENKIKTFVQEGIGALLAYLPGETAVSTLQDFIEILDRPPAPVPTRTEELKLPPVAVPKPKKPKEGPLIEYTGAIELPELRGQVDYLASIDNDTFIVGTTIGQVAIYNSTENKLTKMLINEGLSVYEMAF